MRVLKEQKYSLLYAGYCYILVLKFRCSAYCSFLIVETLLPYRGSIVIVENKIYKIKLKIFLKVSPGAGDT